MNQWWNSLSKSEKRFCSIVYIMMVMVENAIQDPNSEAGRLARLGL